MAASPEGLPGVPTEVSRDTAHVLGQDSTRGLLHNIWGLLLFLFFNKGHFSNRGELLVSPQQQDKLWGGCRSQLGHAEHIPAGKGEKWWQRGTSFCSSTRDGEGLVGATRPRSPACSPTEPVQPCPHPPDGHRDTGKGCRHRHSRFYLRFSSHGFAGTDQPWYSAAQAGGSEEAP